MPWVKKKEKKKKKKQQQTNEQNKQTSKKHHSSPNLNNRTIFMNFIGECLLLWIMVQRKVNCFGKRIIVPVF